MHETLNAISAIHVYISRINYGLAFDIKDGYKLELQTPEIITLFGTTKKSIDKNER